MQNTNPSLHQAIVELALSIIDIWTVPIYSRKNKRTVLYYRARGIVGHDRVLDLYYNGVNRNVYE